MPNDSWTDSQGDQPTPMKKSGMSGCMLASLIVGGVGLVAALACCGVGGWFVSTMIPVPTKVPAEIVAVAHQILNVEIPEDFSPDTAMTMDNMLFTLRIAQFKHKAGKGELMVGVMKMKIGDPKQSNEQSRAFRDKTEQEIRGTLDFKKTEVHEITINGQKVSVSIGEATDRANGKAVHTANAEFDQPAGMTFFLLRMDDDVWDEDAVLKMLEDAKPTAEAH